jgi:clan AA aspartic protease (TIGR02281 family)
MAAVLDLSDKMETTARQYARLAADPRVKAALAQLNQRPGPKARLGPSSAFAQELPGIRRERATVNTATIKFNNDTNTPQVDVRLNGMITISMIFDSGASDVCLSSETAEKLGLKKEPGDPVIRATIANGAVVEGYRKVLKSIRLGPFTAENVDCSVSPPSEKNAPNLLGGTFLQNFVYHMDLANGQVRLTQIAGKSDSKDLADPLPPAEASAPPSTGSAGATGTPPAMPPRTPPAAKDKPADGPDLAFDGKWLVLFRSAYPGHWDTPVSDSQSYSISLDQVPDSMSYLRIKNTTGGYVIVPLSRQQLQQRMMRDKFGWEGHDYDRNGARHLGIFVKTMPRAKTGSIDITQENNSGFTGYGFGNRVNKDDGQGYVWAGKPVDKCVFEIDVTGAPLSEDEKANVLGE